jgi:hypothetical protein
MQPRKYDAPAQDVGNADRRPDDETEGDRSHRPSFSRDRDARPQALSDRQDEAPSVARNNNNKISDEFPESGDVSPSLRPFSDFKRFVDNQVSLLADNFVRFPENLDKILEKMQREQERFIAEERDVSRRWTGNDDSPDQIQMSCQRASPEAKEWADQVNIDMLEESMHHHQTTSLRKILALFQDDVGVLGELDQFASPLLSLAGACYYRPDEEEDEHSLTSPSVWPLSRQPRWLSVEWFKRSSYSPVRLEAHPNTDMASARWRAAFEDLMCSSLDKPMTSRESHKAPVGISNKLTLTTRSSGFQWLVDLQTRGILPPLLPRTYSSHQARNMRTIGEVMQLVRETRADIPLVSDPAILSCSATEQDLSDMISELVIESSPAKIALQGGRDSQTWTELDMYDRLLPSASTTKSGKSHDWHDVARRTTHESEETREDLFTLLANVVGQEVNRQIESSQTGVRTREGMVDRGCDAGKDDGTDGEHTALIAAAKKPGVLSSLTTTETVRLPDGTVTTKVVLKQRFADGREETSERSHTYREESDVHEEESSKKGWFWA